MDRCLNRCNISFVLSRVEDCLELNFKYVDYQTLAHLSYSSCVCLTSVRAARAQRFLSVRVLISDSTKVGRTVGVVTAIEEQLVNSRAPDIAIFSARIYARP